MASVDAQLEGRSDRSSVSRRDFLRVGGLGVVGLSVAEQRALAIAHASAAPRSCILLLMTGGPSQFETFDPKPEAPQHIRGPLKPISTAIPGVQFSEGFPRLAQRAGGLGVLRSLTHDYAPIHQTGLQLLQTGRVNQGELRTPSFGSVVGSVLGSRQNSPAAVVLPRPICDPEIGGCSGQGAGFLDDKHQPAAPLDSNSVAQISASEAATLSHALTSSTEPPSVRDRYGESRFGKLCLQARRLVEVGVRCVTVNLFDRLEGEVTWDCHAQRPSSPATLYDYRDTLCPQFDKALAALLDDLRERGLLHDTLVIATGEFGRTPHINQFGGRDHWPDVFSGIVAGGGIEGGRVIGASDQNGASVAERPINPGELTASIYHFLGLDLDAELRAADDLTLPLIEHEPIAELFA